MDNYALVMKEQLMAIIADMASRKEEFVKAPDKDFTRTRKLSFEDTIILMLSMGGGSLNKELLEYFNYDPNVATSSAFDYGHPNVPLLPSYLPLKDTQCTTQ